MLHPTTVRYVVLACCDHLAGVLVNLKSITVKNNRFDRKRRLHIVTGDGMLNNSSGKFTIFTVAAPAPLIAHFTQIEQARVNFSQENAIAYEIL